MVKDKKLDYVDYSAILIKNTEDIEQLAEHIRSLSANIYDKLHEKETKKI